MSAANLATGQLTARYVNDGGQVLPVQATVDDTGRHLEMVLGFTVPQRFDGCLNRAPLGAMGGTTVWSGMTFGFMGTRRP